MKNENYKSLSSGLTPTKNTNVGDKSLENQRGDPWKNRKNFIQGILTIFGSFWVFCPARFRKWQGSNLKIEISSFHFSSSFCYNKIACYWVSFNLKISHLSPHPIFDMGPEKCIHSERPCSCEYAFIYVKWKVSCLNNKITKWSI